MALLKFTSIVSILEDIYLKDPLFQELLNKKPSKMQLLYSKIHRRRFKKTADKYYPIPIVYGKNKTGVP